METEHITDNKSANQSILSGRYLNTDQILTDLQLNAILDYLSQDRRLDPFKALQICGSAYRRGGRANMVEAKAKLQSHPKIAVWHQEHGSSFLLVRGDFRSRFELKFYMYSMIQALRRSNIPVVWVLNSPLDGVASGCSIIDIIKDLVYQCLRLDIRAQSERTLSISCSRFRGAISEDDWLDILASVVSSFPQLYIIIDLEVVDRRYVKAKEQWSWLEAFHVLSQGLVARNIKTRLKVFLVSYGSAQLQESKLSSFHDSILSIRQANAPKMFQRGKRANAQKALRIPVRNTSEWQF